MKVPADIACKIIETHKPLYHDKVLTTGENDDGTATLNKGHELTLKRCKLLCDNSDVVDKSIATMKDEQTDIKIKIHYTYISMNSGYQCVCQHTEN